MAQKARSHSSTLSIHSSISLYHVSHNIDCVNIKPKEKHTVKRAKIDAQKNTKNEQQPKTSNGGIHEWNSIARANISECMDFERFTERQSD